MLKCRICGRNLKTPFLSLGNSPLSNAFLGKEDLNKAEPYYPLEVYACPECHFAQIEDFSPAESLFSARYPYFSSYSKSWLKHCENYANMAVKRFGLGRNSFVLEIASNDGCLLRFFRKKGIPVLGIEPAANPAGAAIRKGVETKICFFNSALALKMRTAGRSADLIVGNNVLAHNPALRDFTEGLRIALKESGVITMEFPHLLKLLEGNQFDTIYHEHFSYFSFFAVRKLFRLHRLEIFDVEEIPIHGGGLRIYVRHRAALKRTVSPNVEALIGRERESGLYGIKKYRDFAERTRKVKRDLLKFLIKAGESGKSVAGYGAPAKGNTLLNYCGVGLDFMKYTVDRNPHKQGKYLPGTHIPVKFPAEIRKSRPDYVLILPWNIKEEIMKQLHFIRQWGGKFVVPVPELEIL